MMHTPARILWIAPSWLGDAVLSLPALHSLTTTGVTVEVLARQGIERVFADSVPPRALHVVSSGRRWRRFEAAWRLRRRAYAAAVVLPPSFSAALLGWLSGAAHRVGERRRARGVLLTQPLPAAGRDLHLAAAYQRLADTAAAVLGVESRSPDSVGAAAATGTPRLRATEDEMTMATALLRQRGVAPRAALVLAPGARYGPAKRYPAAAFAGAARLAARRLEAPIVLVGSAADAAASAAVQRLLPQAIDVTGETSLPALIGILASARGVLSNDSGVMHLAAALETPVVGIFGSTNPAWTRPLGRHATHVVHPVPCAPCYRRTCPIDFPCMHGISPEAVVAALESVLSNDRPGVPEEVSPL